MARIGVFTIASKNYLAYVRTLFASLAQFHGYASYLCLADRVDGYFEESAEPFAIVPAERLGIQDFEDMTLRYDILEFNTAVKPYMFRWLFEHTTLDAVIYLDPDIRVFSSFERLEELLASGASAVLTPHISEPLEDGKLPNDHTILQAGVFNLGFIALRRSAESLRFVDWWGRQLRTKCVAQPKLNLFVDQRWCDLAPCFLQDLRILRDAGYNVAYWNLVHRKIRRTTGGALEVNGSPLVFFHFSGVDPAKPAIVSKHQDRFQWNDVVEYQPLFEDYYRELSARGWEETRSWPYAYAEAAPGLAISPMVRMLYRTLNPRPRALAAMGLAHYLTALCNTVADGHPPDEGPRITALMKFVYRSRQDLQDAFELQTASGRRRFASWFEEAAGREYGLWPAVTCQKLILGAAPAGSPPGRAIPSAYRVLMTLDRLILNPIYRRLPRALQPAAKRMWSLLTAWALRRH